VVDLSDGADTTIWAQFSDQSVSRITSDLAPDRGGRRRTTGLFQRVVDQLPNVSTTVVTIVAGPLNYVGANPKVDCEIPQPSR
jgi:hypothetical protein